jgi:cysteine desulfurase
MMTLNGGKMYGPKQSGGLYVHRSLKLQPLIDGGGQERAIRSGTENVPAVVGFARALEIAQESRHDEARRLQVLQQQFINGVIDRLPHAQLNGSVHHRLANNIHFSFPGHSNEVLLLKLERRGILAASGSACSADDRTEPSHVLRAIGLSDEIAHSSVRFSLGRGTTSGQIERVVSVLSEVAQP